MADMNTYETDISVLYVEDDQQARNIVISVLEARYPRICFKTADNGSNGLAIFREQTPQIVITDICMPILSGIEMGSAIKAAAPDTILIATSAYSETGYFIKAIEIGFNHFVMKPLDYDLLFAALDRSIEFVRLSRQVRSQQDHIVKLSRALEQSASTVVITDLAGNIDYVNQKFTESTGYSLQEAMGQNVRILKTELTPTAVYRDLWQTISAGRKWLGELINRKRNGELYCELVSISPLKDADGATTHYVAVKEDITERKRAEAEIRELNAALVAKAQMLETANLDLEAFNATVSHDLRTHVSAVSGFAQVLQKRKCLEADDDCRQYLDIIVTHSETMEKLIDTLLRFSRLTFHEIKRQKVDLSSIALEISLQLHMWQPERNASFAIAENMDCSGDNDLMRIVMENLLGNAWKYSARQDRAVIEVNRTTILGEPVFYVRDNGVGFDGKQSSNLFKTFTRLHQDDDFGGFGIGLATVQRIIEKHGGRIWAESTPEQGATFYFTLQEQEGAA